MSRFAAGALILAAAAAAAPATRAATSPVAARFAPPAGFTRVQAAPGSFGAWLRALPVKEGRPPVLLHDGTPKWNQDAHVAVLDLGVGKRDLQQCADAVIRLRAEYLVSGTCRDDVAFRFTSGDEARWSDWRDGLRPKVSGASVTWARTAEPDGSDASFRRYLDTVFTYAGTASLQRDLVKAPDPAKPEPGDVFVQGGFPGHAVIVLDVAQSATGARVFLLAQSYMPAQEIHVLKSFGGESPWYVARAAGMLPTPEWEFEHGDLRRFPRLRCEGAGR